VIAEFRADDGRVSGSLTGTPILLLHHVGARSGVERVTPLAYTPHGGGRAREGVERVTPPAYTPHEGGRYLIVASNGGSPRHPSWYYNLKEHPKTRVEMDAQTFTARAEGVQGTGRRRGGGLV